jgi:hypothetical protein
MNQAVGFRRLGRFGCIEVRREVHERERCYHAPRSKNRARRRRGHGLRLSSGVTGVTWHHARSPRRKGIVKLKSLISQKKSFFDRKGLKRTASAVFDG